MSLKLLILVGVLFIQGHCYNYNYLESLLKYRYAEELAFRWKDLGQNLAYELWYSKERHTITLVAITKSGEGCIIGYGVDAKNMQGEIINTKVSP